MRPQTFVHRHATVVQVLLTLGLYAQFSVLAGIAATPGVYAALRLWSLADAWPLPLTVMLACALGWGAFFSYAVCIIFVVGAFRIVTRASAPAGRFRFYSYPAYQWARYNALILLVRYTSLNFIRVTPFINVFHRLMGMRIGRRVQINTAVIGDSNLIEIGDDSVIGGDVTLVAHAAAHGVFVTAPVRIGHRVTVGLMAVILPGVTLGDGAVILPNSVVEMGTRVGPGETWGGIPAICVRTRQAHPSTRPATSSAPRPGARPEGDAGDADVVR